MSWEQLAAKSIPHIGQPSTPYFSAETLARARNIHTAAVARVNKWASRAVVAPLAYLVFLGACIATLSGDWAGLLSRDAVSRMGDFARGFFFGRGMPIQAFSAESGPRLNG